MLARCTQTDCIMSTPRSLLSSFWRRPLRVVSPRTTGAQPLHRVEAKVGGQGIWFESPDLSLRNSVEAVGSAFTIPAAARGRGLTFDPAPDPVWLANARQAQAIAAEWWGYRGAPAAPAIEPATTLSPAARHSALCFTCGVDSFYSLLRSERPIERVLFVHGYDIELADTNRALAAEQSLRQVSAELGALAVLVRTNLRHHGLLQCTNWEHTHGGALAAIGHLLSEHVDELLISSSYPRVFDRPWGSHWKLDSCWSSSRMTVTHVGADKWRTEKLVELRNEPLVRRHLRVCWEHRSPAGNCGQCEKCLRTMLILHGHGCLDAFPVFPASARLADNLEQLSHLKEDHIRVYSHFLAFDLNARVGAALSSLLERSERRLAAATTSTQVQHA